MRTNVTLTWESLSWAMTADWRLLTVSHSSVDGSSQSTPHLWVHCVLIGARGRERKIKTERLLSQRDIARNAPSRSWYALLCSARRSGRRDWRSVVC